MLLRALMPSAFALCLATGSVLAQGSTVSEQDARQAADSAAKKFETAYNAGDAAGIASLFAESGTYLTPGGTVLSGSDRQAIERAIAGRMKAGWTSETVKITEAHAAGNAVWATGEYGLTGTGQSSGKQISGHFAEVLTRDGNDWRFRMLIANLTPSHDVTGMAAASAPGAAPPK
jgi:uncharacterized protein (TIGR02246 family)